MLSLNRGFFARTGDTDFEAVEALEETLALFSDLDDGGTKAALLAALASELVWAESGDRRFELSDRALAMARRAIGSACRSPACSCLRNMTILAPDTLSERTANCYELLGLAEEVQDDTIRFDAAFHRGGTALEAGDAEAANDMVELAARVAGSLHQPRFLWQARLMQTAQAVFRGSLDDAEFFADEALDLGRRAGQNADAFVFHTEQTFEIERWRGNLAEHIEELRPFAGQPAWDFGYVLTRYLYEAGDTVAASEIYRRIVATTFLPLRRDMLAAPALYNLALLATRERGSGDGGGALHRAPAVRRRLREHDRRQTRRLALPRDARGHDRVEPSPPNPTCARRSRSTTWSARHCSAPRAKSNSHACCSNRATTTGPNDSLPVPTPRRPCAAPSY